MREPSSGRLEDHALLVPGVSELVLVVLGVAVIAATVLMARRRGRSGWVWGLMAVFFSPFALLVVAVLPSRAHRAAA